MEWNDHNPPHFHVKYAGDEATIEIATLIEVRWQSSEEY